MSNPLVSVAMVTCNADRFLAQAIESILDQTFRDFEFIIVDFGSTDKSVSIISTYAAKDRRIRLHLIPNCSMPEARNAACFLAQGQYIAIMDADDVAAKDRLLKEVDFIGTHPEVGLVGGAVEWIDSNGQSLAFNYVPTGDSEIRASLAVRCPFWHATVLMRREAFALVGGYRSAFAVGEDYDLWLRIAEHFQCANLREVLLKYRIHSGQISVRKLAQQTVCLLGAQAAAKSRKNGLPDPVTEGMKITAEALTDLGVTRSTQRRAFASDYRRWIRHMCWAGEYSTALNAALEILRSDLEDIEPWQIADLDLVVAELLWREGQFLTSLQWVGRAVLTRPLVAGRPLKSLLGGLQRVWERTLFWIDAASIGRRPGLRGGRPPR